MKSYKDMINEVLAKSTPIEEAKELDKACWKGYKAIGLKNKNGKKVPNCVPESYAGSQNSTATTDMSENHLVHVNDGSKYDEQPHEKDVEHVMAGVKLHGGENAGVSDKGVFFKFKSPEHASSFISHVNKCPNKSCDAHISEAITYGNAYPGLGTDVVDKKKKLNPQPNLTMKPKQVKDFTDKTYKGYSEELDEAKVYDPFTKKMVPTKPIKVQFGGGATRNGVPVETGPSKYKSKLPMSKAAGVLAAEEVELIDELDKKTIGSYAKKATKDLKWQQTMRPFDAKRISNREKGIDKAIDKLTKEEVEKIDELSKRTLARYAKRATSSMKMKQMAATHLRDKHRDASDKHQSGVFNRELGIKRAIDKLAGKYYHEDVQINELSKGLVARYANKAAKTTQANYDKSKDKFQFSSNRQDGMKNAVKRLTKEEVQIDEVSKSTLMRYIPKASRDVADNVYSAKDQVNRSTEHTRAGDWDASKTAHTKATTLFKKANKRIAGIDAATKKLGTQKEEIQVDESKGLPHALVQAGKSKWHIYDTKTREVHSTYNNKNVAIKKYGELNDKHAGYDSPGGLVRAKYGVRQEPMREEVQVDEAIAKKLPVQHAVDAVHATLGPRSATRFLSHLSPGSDKHTTWDKVNDALVKQGVQTRHIASIAQKTSHANVNESRGHKVLATFFKNREVAQRAYQGNPAKDAEVAQGGGSPADQGIAAAKKDAADLKKKLNEDQYTSEYKIKSYVDPVTGENKTRKIRPHRINFKSSKMNAAPAQMTEPTKVTEGHDDYSSIAKELIKKHGKNVTAQHVKDFAGERDTHRGLDHAEVMHHVKKLSEDDKVYDEKWKKVKFTDFIKGAK